MQTLDQKINRLRKDIDELLPNWVEDIVLRDIDPNQHKLVGIELAKERDTFVKLEQIKEKIKDARKEIIAALQAKCPHEFIVKFPKKSHLSKYSTNDDYDKYICEVCGLAEDDDNWNRRKEGGLVLAKKRHRVKDEHDDYYKIRNITKIKEIT